eukprot:748714-Hanusia_phi.AAC.3
MSNQWEMAAYVLLASIDTKTKMDTSEVMRMKESETREEDDDVCWQDEATERWSSLHRSSVTSAFRSLLARHSEKSDHRGYDITVKGVCVLQESDMLQVDGRK